MIGLGSIGAALAFWLCLGATALCVVYGLKNWNADEPDSTGYQERPTRD
jgi:hypothetical protein